MNKRERPRGRTGDAPRPEGEGVAEISRSNEPIAIVGMACRFPGAADLESFWRLLEAGRNARILPLSGKSEEAVRALAGHIPFTKIRLSSSPVHRADSHVVLSPGTGTFTKAPAELVRAGPRPVGGGPMLPKRSAHATA